MAKQGLSAGLEVECGIVVCSYYEGSRRDLVAGVELMFKTGTDSTALAIAQDLIEAAIFYKQITVAGHQPTTLANKDGKVALTTSTAPADSGNSGGASTGMIAGLASAGVLLVVLATVVYIRAGAKAATQKTKQRKHLHKSRGIDPNRKPRRNNRAGNPSWSLPEEDYLTVGPFAGFNGANVGMYPFGMQSPYSQPTSPGYLDIRQQPYSIPQSYGADQAHWWPGGGMAPQMPPQVQPPWGVGFGGFQSPQHFFPGGTPQTYIPNAQSPVIPGINTHWGLQHLPNTGAHLQMPSLFGNLGTSAMPGMQNSPKSPTLNPYSTNVPSQQNMTAGGAQEAPVAPQNVGTAASILEPVVSGWDTEANPVPDADFWTTINASANAVKEAGGDGAPGYQMPN